MQDKNEKFGTFECTSDELSQLQSIQNDLLLNKKVSTVKQAEHAAIATIKEQRKKVIDDAKKAKEAEAKAKSDLMLTAYGITHTASDGYPENIGENYVKFVDNNIQLETIRFEEFSERIFYGEREFTDYDLSHIALLASTDCHLNSRAMLQDAINEVAMKNRFHVVKEYLESLTWDKKKRIPTMFTDFLGAPDCRLHQAQAVIFMVAAVKRIYEPGCKFDNMIILSGPQGLLKSTFCEKLAHNSEWYAENIPIGDKDAYQHLLTSWIVNMDEITSLNKKDAATAKNFLTASSDKFRQSYAKYAKTYKRHCIFIGTTNEENFLKDSTAATERRYWPIQCSGTRSDSIVRFKKLTEDYIGQLWAEAMFYYNKGNCNIPMYIPEELWTEFVTDQVKYKSENDSELYDFLDDALNRKYVDFPDDSSFAQQYKSAGLLTGNMQIQDKFTANSVNILLKENHIFFQRGYLKLYAELRPKDWTYKKFKYGNRSVWGIVRNETKATDDAATKNIDNLFGV